MKNKKLIAIISVFVILIFGVFLLNGNNGTICHNLDWKDNPNEVKEKLSKLDLRYLDNGINKENEKVNLEECVSINDMGCLLYEEYVKSNSPSIKINDIDLESYKVRTIHDANQEIIEASEIFVVSEYKYNLFINSLKDKLIDMGAKYDSDDELDNTIYKTKSNYIMLIINKIDTEELYGENEYEIIVNYYNPKFNKEEILNSEIFNSVV